MLENVIDGTMSMEGKLKSFFFDELDPDLIRSISPTLFEVKKWNTHSNMQALILSFSAPQPLGWG